MIPILLVVNEPRDWSLKLPDVELVRARDYLTDPVYARMKGAKVFNLCRSYRYQSTGYYVSLLAAARGHKPIPNVLTMRDLGLHAVVRIAGDDLDELIQKCLAPLKSDRFVLSIYFGRNLAKRYEALSLRLFKLFEAPLLRASFIYNVKASRWLLQSVGPIATSEIPPEHQEFVVDAARRYFTARHRPRHYKVPPRYDLAILRDPGEAEAPSNTRALKRFAQAAESLGMDTEFIERDDYARLAEFDALFIRETTSVNHHTYRFARRAAAEGLVVVDDPESILKCTNKVFLAELLARHKVPSPETMIIHRDNLREVPGLLGLPCILKQPDSSFSQGVIKVGAPEELREAAQRMLEKSDLIVGQRFIPTPFDWRVGIFDRQPLYVCKYYMAKQHWQIINRSRDGRKTDEGTFETMALADAPPTVVNAALRAANLIGDGLYGVDVKQLGKRAFVIEVNDNPNVDAGVEDRILQESLYLRIMGVMLARIEQRKERFLPR